MLDLTNHPELEPYYLAPSGESALSDQWRDKPHRLVYDLINMAVERSAKDQRDSFLDGYLSGLATAKDIAEKQRDEEYHSFCFATCDTIAARIQQEIDEA